MSTPSAVSHEEFIERVIEAAIRLGLLYIWLGWCYRIISPVIFPVVWAIIIAVAVQPMYAKLLRWLGGRRWWAAGLVTIAMLLLLAAPTVVIGGKLIQNLQSLESRFSTGEFKVPELPESVKTWRVVGPRVAAAWQQASANLPGFLASKGVEPRAILQWFMHAMAGAGINLLQFLVAFLLSGVFMAYSGAGHRLTHAITVRILGDRGGALTNLAENTLRSVAHGVIGVAVIQAILAGMGFIVADIPGSGILTLLCLILAIIQIGPTPILIGAVIYKFHAGDALSATLFLAWCGVVGISDNVLKAVLLGRGVDVPLLVILLGAIGGMMTAGVVGLFLGAVILALSYKLFHWWLYGAQA